MKAFDDDNLPQTKNIINVLSAHKQDDNFTELHIAVKKNSLSYAEHLLQNGGVPLNSQTTNGITSLLLSCLLPASNIAKLLIKSGADVNIADMVNFTPLLAACKTNKLEIVELLLQSGADINHQDDCGYTALHYAIDNDDLNLVEILLHSGADTSLTDCNGWNALMMALHDHEESFAAKILPFTEDVNAVSNNGWSALMLAASSEGKDIVFGLVEKGADVNINVDGDMPVTLALERVDFNVFEYLWNLTDIEVFKESCELFSFIQSLLRTAWITPNKIECFYKVLNTPGIVLDSGGFLNILSNAMIDLETIDDFLSVDVCGIMNRILEKGAYVNDLDICGFISFSYKYIRMSDKYKILEMLLNNNADFNLLYYIQLAVKNDPELTSLLLPLCISLNPIDVLKCINNAQRLDIPMLKLIKYTLNLCSPNTELREKTLKHIKSFNVLDSDYIYYSIIKSSSSLGYHEKQYIIHVLNEDEQAILPILYNEVLDLLSQNRVPSLKELTRDKIRKCLANNCVVTQDFLQSLDSLNLPCFMNDIIQCKTAVTYFE